MPTIKEIADACGCSKSTAARKARELGLRGRADGGRRTLVFDERAASAISAAVLDGRPAPAKEPEPADVLAMSAQTAEALERANDRLEREVERYGRMLDAERGEHVKALERERDRADAAETEAARLRAEVVRLERELGMSRALEGFHWPWSRKAIIERYLPPAANG